jgi:hypothetical protein
VCWVNKVGTKVQHNANVIGLALMEDVGLLDGY